MTWNVANITRSKSREIELGVMLQKEAPDVAVLTEVELDEEDSSFHISGYKTFYSSPFECKIRVLLLLKDALVMTSNPVVLAVSHQDIWVWLACPSGSGSWTFGACYRQWNGTEAADLHELLEHAKKCSASSSRVLLLGDFNLDAARRGDPLYYRRKMLNTFLSGLDELGFRLENDVGIPTFQSHGCFKTGEGFKHRESVLDLIFSLGALDLRPEVRVLPNAASDHRPVAASFPIHRGEDGGQGKVLPGL